MSDIGKVIEVKDLQSAIISTKLNPDAVRHKIEDLAEQAKELCELMKNVEGEEQKRWVAIAKTELQKGMMALRKATYPIHYF